MGAHLIAKPLREAGKCRELSKSCPETDALSGLTANNADLYFSASKRRRLGRSDEFMMHQLHSSYRYYYYYGSLSARKSEAGVGCRGVMKI